MKSTGRKWRRAGFGAIVCITFLWLVCGISPKILVAMISDAGAKEGVLGYVGLALMLGGLLAVVGGVVAALFALSDIRRAPGGENSTAGKQDCSK